jgi:hypothetical protein
MTKKIYNQPQVQVAHIALESMVLAGSPAGNTMGMSNIPTDDQW